MKDQNKIKDQLTRDMQKMHRGIAESETSESERKREEKALRESERYYRLLAENVTDVIWTTDMNLRFTYLSPSVTRTAGYSVEEGMTKTLKDVLTPTSVKIAMKAFEEELALQKMKKGEPARSRMLELELVCGDGSTIWTEAKMTFLRDPHGRPVGILGVARDITERKRAQVALKESEKRYRSFFEQAADSILLVDAETEGLVEFNDKAHENLGYTREEFEKLKIPDFEVTESAEEVARHIERIIKNGGDTFETKHRRKDGEVRDIQVSSRAITIGGRRFIQSICRDMTDRKRAEEVCKTLARLGIRLAAADTVESMITVVREETDRLFGWDAHYFAVRRPEEDTFRVISFVDTVDGQKKAFPERDWPAANLSRQLHPLLEGRPVLINRAPGDPGPVLTRFGDKDRISASLMHVPVRSGDDVVGILSAQSYTCGRYDEADLEALQRIADAVAPAIGRAYAEEALQEAEERFRTLFENLPIGLYRTTPDGRVLMANPALVRMLGYSSLAELAQRNLEESGFEPEYPRSVFKERIEKEGQFVGLDSAWTKRDGTVVMVRESARAVRDDAGSILYYEGTAEDITEQKRTQEKLDEMFKQIMKHHDDLLSILNMLRLGIVMVDRDGSVTFLNQTAQHLTGKSQREVLGRHWEQFFSFDARDKARLKDMFARPSEERKRLQARVEFRGGRRYWMDIEAQDDPRNPQRKIFFFYDMSEVYDLRRMLEEKAQFHDLVGKSKLMQSIYQRIQEVSKVDWTVLIDGETGTGKELVARAIHFSSHRKEKPFIAVNCAGLTDSLLASQLFGHKRGAFTGAVEDHKGLFEVANGGTLFLDEIGDISKSMQTSLLRVLEEKEITPLGESRSQKTDVRILASTHRDLSQEVEKGNFRPDLLYRIRVARIKLPPLRERREDIPLLVGAFLSQSRAATGKPVEDVSRETMRVLLEYDWPGNVRELKSAIDVATLHCQESAIQPADLPPEIIHSTHPQSPAGGPHQDEEHRVLAALETAKGNRTLAASLLGISRATLYRRLASLGIKPTK